MNAELEKIVDAVLANGELTARSRELLMKKAEQLGVDLLDFELELESKIALKKASTSGPLPIYTSPTPQSNKEGTLKKCPSCGALVQSFATKCSYCGHEFRNIESSRSVTDFFNKINSLEENSSSINSVTSMFSGITGMSKIDNQKKEMIKNFPVPNSKEDILEFLSMAVPLSKKSTFIDRLKGNFDPKKDIFAPVWLSKCEQIIMKARFSMKDDKKTLAEIEEYAKKTGIK